MIRPNKRLVGVTVDDERDKQSLNVLNETSEADIDNVASLEIEELLQDGGGYESETHNQNSIFVQVSGSPVYKATIVKEVLNSNTHVSSADRLRRERGYSKHSGSSETEDNEDALDLDDALMLGETMAVKLLYDKDSVALAFVKIMSMKSKWRKVCNGHPLNQH